MVQKDREKIITKNTGIEYEIQYRQITIPLHLKTEFIIQFTQILIDFR